MPTPNRPSFGVIIVSVIVVVASFSVFRTGLDAEPFFADESAHLAQTYYYRLLIDGRQNDVDWLHIAAYDHLPVYKCLMGVALGLTGTPRSIASIERWQAGEHGRPSDARLHAARMPMLLGAVWGCLFMFLLGRQLLGPLTGLAAAVLLAASPLYYHHARRAMADDLTLALVLTTFVAVVALARRLGESKRRWRRCSLAVLAGGLACGLAAATKLNGAIAGVAVAGLAAVSILTLCRGGLNRPAARLLAARPEDPAGRGLLFVGGTLATGIIAVAVFVGIDPYFYAAPDLSAPQVQDRVRGWHWTRVEEARELAHLQELADLGVLGRTRHMLRYRAEALANGQKEFPDRALRTVGARLRAIVREGMGRHTVAGYLSMPGIGWLLPALLVLIGLRRAWVEGWLQVGAGEIPIAWLLLTWPAAEVLVLAGNLALNYDRYFMGVVAWSSLLAAFGIASSTGAIFQRMVLRPQTDEDPAAAAENADRAGGTT